jgi:hypothetical protein
MVFEHRPEYLYVYVKSDVISYEIAKRYWVEILAMQHRRRYDRILVDKDISRSLAPHDVFTLVSELAHSGCSGVRFAIVDRYYDEERSPFEEMVGTNRGLDVKVLADGDEAEEWLVGR